MHIGLIQPTNEDDVLCLCSVNVPVVIARPMNAHTIENPASLVMIPP